jgi:hypothetical protein
MNFTREKIPKLERSQAGGQETGDRGQGQRQTYNRNSSLPFLILLAHFRTLSRKSNPHKD